MFVAAARHAHTHLLGRHTVVVEHIATERAQHDDSHHARQQEHNQQRVHNGEPVHLHTSTQIQSSGARRKGGLYVCIYNNSHLVFVAMAHGEVDIPA